jgi:hypothetical protein
MIRKLSLIVIVFTALQFILLVACENCGPFPDRYKLKSMTLNLCLASFDTEHGYLFLTHEVPDNPIRYSEVGLQLVLAADVYFSANRHFPKLGLIETMVACSPNEPTTGERIDSIVITSDFMYSEQFKAGANLAPIFDVVVTNSFYGIHFEKYDLLAYLKTKPVVPQEMVFLLKTAPASSGKHRFTIKYYQNGVDIDCVELQSGTVEITG